MFSCYTKKVLEIIKGIKVDTEADTWMKGKRFGKEAMLALQNHCDGKSEGELRKQMAKYYLKRLFYRNKPTLYFEEYVTKMKKHLIY